MVSEADRFEERVRGLLRLQGWAVEDEILVGHKKVDALIRRRDEFGQLKTLALECKDYSRKLSRPQISNIFSDYLGLLESRAVDGVILVTSRGVSPSAGLYCDSLQGLVHLTEEQLAGRLMDFSLYLAGLIADYEEDLSGLYVEQNYLSGSGVRSEALEEDLLEWIASSDCRPRAVLAGYGMGKSTLSRRLAYILSKAHQDDLGSRLPILLPLEHVASEQSLEGLLGKHFTSTFSVSNYNFHLFMRLASQGRFVILLDGFDEMKQTMSWETMRYNFQQLNRLVIPGNKVVIFGRPTAFLNQDEYLEAIHGQRVVGKKRVQLPGWPRYSEIVLLPFDEDQMIQFIDQHLAAKGESIELDRLQLDGGLLADLISRPVQLKMLLEVLPVFDDSLDHLSISVLYSEFIDLVIRREMEKTSRQAFSLRQRRRFAADLAFWLWNKGGRTSIGFENIPSELFTRHLKADLHPDSVKRDLLSACFLERKEPGGYYFPHRSFVEFLVAERLASYAENKPRQLDKVSFMNPEVASFFVSLVNERWVHRWHKQVLVEKSWRPGEAALALFRTTCREFGLEITKKQLNSIAGRNKVVEIELGDNDLKLFRERTQANRHRKSTRKKGAVKKKHYR